MKSAIKPNLLNISLNPFTNKFSEYLHNPFVYGKLNDNQIRQES